MRQQFLRQQMEGQQSEAELRRAQLMAAQEKARRDAEQLAMQRSILGGIAGSQQMGFRDANIAMSGVAPAGYQPPGQRNPITQDVVAQWVSAGGDPDVLKKLAESGDWGRAEVARVLDTADQQGRPQQQQFDKFGRSVGSTLAKPYEKKMVNTGGAQVGYDPYTLGLTGQSIANTMTPGEMASNRVAQANLGLSQARLNFDKSQAEGGGPNGGVQYITTPTGIIAVPKKPGAGPIQGTPVTDAAGLPVGGTEGGSKSQRVAEAKDAIALLDQADKLIDKSTSSYAGVGVDQGARVFGVATPGAEAAAQLRALEGALIAKMPKMSGPQSDKDVLLYKQMAGQIGDPTIPAATKKAALSTIREIQNRAAGISSADQSGLGTGKVSGQVGGGWSMKKVP
jgi:hypothetical protein